jgi:hypothetical protein
MRLVQLVYGKPCMHVTSESAGTIAPDFMSGENIDDDDG